MFLLIFQKLMITIEYPKSTYAPSNLKTQFNYCRHLTHFVRRHKSQHFQLLRLLRRGNLEKTNRGFAEAVSSVGDRLIFS